MSTPSEIPLFPLSSVLLPYGRMALQIFEQRYLDLVKNCMRSSTGFGVVWLKRGPEVAGSSEPDIGAYGTYARIIDWDQLPNGLLGVTIEGSERFALLDSYRLPSKLLMGQVSMAAPLAPAPLLEGWEGFADILRSLETHPHVQRIGLEIDYNNAWQVAYTLLQLLPLDEALKYEMLGIDSSVELVRELDLVLNEISGAD